MFLYAKFDNYLCQNKEVLVKKKKNYNLLIKIFLIINIS